MSDSMGDQTASIVPLRKQAWLAQLYEQHRRCLVEEIDGTIREVESARRMTLGFDKVMALVAATEIGVRDIVLSCFGGPGGTVRILSLLHPRLLIATDLYYRGPLARNRDWVFASDFGFEAWKEDVSKLCIGRARKVIFPLFLQMDIRKPLPALRGAIDRMVIDPPYGKITFELLGLNVDTGRELFAASLVAATRLLRPGGVAAALVPEQWTSEVARNVPQLAVIAKQHIGSGELEIVSFRQTANNRGAPEGEDGF
jgi:hypothetical protein